MKKIIPVIVLMVFLLAGCSLLTGGNTDTPLSDAQMATRVAELLATMTTPTTEIDFPPSPTVALPTVMTTIEVITATPDVALTETPPTATPVVETATPTLEEITVTPTVDASTATPTPTATIPASDPSLALGTATGSDTMDSATKWSWPSGQDDYLKVVFNNSKMEMTGLTNFAGWRLPLISQQVNTYIELTADSGSCTGKDSYGIIFRVPVLKDPTQGYLYEVTCDGYYRLWKWDGEVSTNGQATVLVPWSQSSLINAGANQSNRLGVKVVDKTYTLYMNGVELASASDTSFMAGFFGVFVRSVATDDYTVKFDSMRYWENP